MMAKSRTSPFPSLSYKEIVLNKLQDRFQYTEGELPKKSVKQFTLRDVAKVDIIYSTDRYENIYFTPRITMTFGVEYYLDAIRDRQAAIAIANNLNRFIGLSEEEDPVVKQ